MPSSKEVHELQNLVALNDNFSNMLSFLFYSKKAFQASGSTSATFPQMTQRKESLLYQDRLHQSTLFAKAEGLAVPCGLIS